ncbi:MAG: HAD family hydrolase [Acidobacteria bacterium]|nr:HAD family hydrolase [Acidobacteriota bacterium]MBI3427807.1 HAD family hydrolase [Acidobacteriota bacterium]
MKDAKTQLEPRRAIFLDRDGTLNEEMGYLRSLADLRFCAGAVEAVRLINEADWLALVLTNQSGVARGLFPESFIGEAHAEMQRRLQPAGARLDAFYVCPHLPFEHVEVSEALRQYRIECDCRKPKPGLIKQAAADFGIDVARSFVIGDRYRDVEMGHSAGAQGVLVLTGYGREEYAQRAQWPRQPEFVAANLLEAVQFILSTASACLESAIRNPQSAIESSAIEPCAF